MPATRACGLRLDLVDVGPLGASSVRPERLAQPGQAAASPPHIWRARSIASTRLTRASPGRRRAEHVQAVADLGVLDLAEPAVDVQDEVVELRRRRAARPGRGRGPAWRPGSASRSAARIAGSLAGSIAAMLRVLVEQLLEPGDVAVGLGAGHRRDQVVDERGVRPALGLGALARVVDQERVDQRQVAERRVGAAGGATCPASCRAATPGCRACRGARPRRAPNRPRLRRGEPAVGGQVVVATAAGPGRGRSRPGSRRSRAAAGPSARRCRRAGRRARSSRRASTNSSPGAGPQCASTPSRKSSGSVVEPARVASRPGSGPGCRPAAPRSASPGPARRPRSARGSARSPSCSATPGKPAPPVRRRSRPRASRRSSRTATAGVSRPTALPIRACLVGYADSMSTIRSLRGRDVPQPGVAHRDPGDPGGALGVGDVDRQPVGVDLLERERHGDDPAVELGDRDLGGDVERATARRRWPPTSSRLLVRQRPCRIGTSSAASARDVPGLVVAAGATRRPGLVPPAASTVTTSASAARSVVQQLGLGRAQRGAEHRQRPRRRRPRSRRTAPRRRRCSPRAGGPGSRGRRRSGRPCPSASRSRTPQLGSSTGGSKPSPVSRTVSERKACSCARFAGPPWAR